MPEDNSQRAVMLNREGLSFLDENKIEEAIETFTQAIAADPNYTPPYTNRAECLRRVGREEEARQDELLYNTISVGGRFPDIGRPRARHAIVGPDAVREEGHAEARAANPPPSSGELEQRADTAGAGTPEAGSKSAGARSHEVEVTSARIHPPQPRIFRRERGWQEQATGRAAGQGLKPDGGLPAPSELLVSVRQYTSDRNSPPAGSWILNRWGFREGTTAWTIERLFRTLFLMTAFGVGGVLIARVSFCPEGLTSSFWVGCESETLGLGLGGVFLGGIIGLLVTRGLIR